MNKFAELLPGAWLISLTKIDDLRGSFVKTLSRSMLDKLGCRFDFQEEYYSISKKNVIRGMHFQLPPQDHEKIVYCLAGAVVDVLLDLRPGPTYGKFRSLTLSASALEVLIIPRGIAHGFRSLVDDSLLVYKTSSEYAPDCDSGIRWNSFNYDWGSIDPIISLRDQSLPVLSDFRTPFAAI